MFLKRYYFKKYCIDLSKSKTLREYSERITLKKLYELTGIQFTCTSVDIDDYILRFFNHKTTPDLPVLESVHISGSFPIVFESQKWKKEWGKYYIHYANTRR